MKKITTSLSLLLLLVATGAQAQFLGWQGDWRVGLMSNANYQLSTPKVHLGDYITKESIETGLCYGYGLYVGMQKDMGNSDWAWGLDGIAFFAPADWRADFKSIHFPFEKYSYYMTQFQFTGLFQAHAAYFLGHSLQAQAGIGPFAQLILQQTDLVNIYNINGLITYSVAEDVKNSMAGTIGAAASLGLTYYIANNFFVKGDFNYYLPFLKKDAYSNPILSDKHYLISYAEDGYKAVSFNLIIGVLW
ncbi:MAG: hypothetical protein SPJ13_05550 [Bacteroidales bacterium]|nr:hypothetical protein [Bacteroidales bacterium]